MYDRDRMTEGRSAKVGVGVLVVKRGQGSPKVLVSQRCDGHIILDIYMREMADIEEFDFNPGKPLSMYV